MVISSISDNCQISLDEHSRSFRNRETISIYFNYLLAENHITKKLKKTSWETLENNKYKNTVNLSSQPF